MNVINNLIDIYNNIYNTNESQVTSLLEPENIIIVIPKITTQTDIIQIFQILKIPDDIINLISNTLTNSNTKSFISLIIRTSLLINILNNANRFNLKFTENDRINLLKLFETTISKDINCDSYNITDQFFTLELCNIPVVTTKTILTTRAPTLSKIPIITTSIPALTKEKSNLYLYIIIPIIVVIFLIGISLGIYLFRKKKTQ